MKCHQVLTGACNPGDKTFGVGSVEGVRLTAYAAGCNITILANNFQRVQIIPGICHNNVQISCVDVSNNTGKIAVAYENKVCVFEPTPLLTRDSKHGLDYWWVKTGELDLECKVASLSWNHEGTRLLTAGEVLQMWKYNEKTKFDMGEDEEEKDQFETRCGNWESIWRIRPPNPVFYLAFSSDGSLFATAGRSDRLVRIWYKNQLLLVPSQTIDSDSAKETYGFIYVAHPRPVSGFSWRDTSKYMPRCAVANMLVTNCEDNISRLWCETVLPDDGLISLQQLDPAASQDPHFRAHRQKQRFIERLKHMRQSFATRKMMRENDEMTPPPIPSLPSSYSVHDFHNFSFQGMGVSPGMHFHLAATINALTDIPLVPAMNSPGAAGVVHKFSLHWLNNKEIYFSLEAEKILQELAKVALKREDSGLEKELLLSDPKDKDQRPQRAAAAAELSPTRPIASRDGVGEGGSGPGGGLSHTPSVTSFNTDISQPSTVSAHQLTLSEALDQRIEVLLQDWHQSSDLLFSVHPVDGSLLVWVADFLDEYQPGAFRQAQVSFSSRIPNAIPIGDASTMSSNVSIFNSKHLLNINQILKEELAEEEEEEEEVEPSDGDVEQDNKHDFKDKLVSIVKKYDVSPIVSMISKHENGTLNLWDVTFSPDTKFCQLLNISHKARVNGHRFRVNDITPHPVLPLLLTTSHHNMSAVPSGPRTEENFCSELILWRVDPISPISKPGSGGISELARINSREICAFTNVAWIPTLLPSSVLGNLSNSPSACFVSSDGKSLRVYQAVIDARSLLAELNSSARKETHQSSLSLASGSPVKKDFTGVYSSIVSAQSSARPGVVIDLDQIEDTQQNWQNTILLHTFHYEMVHGSVAGGAQTSSAKLGLISSSMSAMVDLRHEAGFRELFYVVLAEKVGNTTLMHMWKLVLESPEVEANKESNSSSRSQTPEEGSKDPPKEGRRVLVSSSKVCSQELPLPDNVSVIQCVPAAGHMSSSSIYPACLAPYLLVTACSDNTIRFWTVVDTSGGSHLSFEWEEWKMETEHISSVIEVPGHTVSVSAAYTGRIAVAYRSGESFTRKLPHGHSSSSYVNLFVSIYECESSGGIEWVLEDKIVLKNIEIPRIEPAVDQTVFHTQEKKINAYAKLQKNLYVGSKLETEEKGQHSPTHIPRVPSQATLSKLRQGFDQSSPDTLVPKQLVQLDWVSNEDGSHLLTVAVANKVLVLTTVSADVSQACKLSSNEMKKSQTPRPLLRKTSSIGLQPTIDELKWMIFRKIELQTADGLPPLPMSVSWARDGVLMCAMDNEVAVYCQWKADNALEDKAEENDQRRLKEKDLISIAQETQSNLKSNLKVSSKAEARFFTDSEEKAKQLIGDNVNEDDFMSDLGLFEASHLACPVLPQYHPKQLMELLNSGKIRWVKAILNHLVKCISPSTPRSRSETHVETEKASWAKSRTLSIVGGINRSPSPIRENQRTSTSGMPEEVTLDYAEIHAVAPLPLWMLLEADNEKGSSNTEIDEYNQLFSDKFDEGEEIDLDIIIEDDESSTRQRRMSVSSEKQGLSFFGPRQARLLSKLLTHSQLPGLTSLDQMHLMALADTVASCNVDIAERFAIDAAKSAISKESTLGGSGGGELSLDSLDDCGLRFLLAMKHYCYLQRCLPLSQRLNVTKNGLNTSNVIWGFHSESEEELVDMVPCMSRGSPTWAELRELGVVWWVRSNVTLRRLVENLAKAAFQKNQEPLDAALFYLAMKKKSLVWGLYRSIRDDKMTQFFKNDFSEERWRKAALKNAFALLGKQRFLHAAAFFLLSGSLKDAMEIIISKLNDIQLAMLIGRLYDGATETYPVCVQQILKTKVLGYDEDGLVSKANADPDPFLRSIGYWILKDYESSLTTLLERNVGHDHPNFDTEENNPILSRKTEADPLVFNFYVYLRTHPLIIRHKATKGSEDRNKALMLSGFKTGSFDDGNVLIEDSVTPLERKLFFSTASFHLRGGCPALALEVLSKLPARVSSTPATEVKESKIDTNSGSSHNIMQTGQLDESAVDWGKLGRVSPTKNVEQQASKDFGLDWGAPVTVEVQQDEDELKLEWSDDGDDDDDNDDENQDQINVLEKNKSLSFHEEDVTQDQSKFVIDIMAQQMKFTACLRIMMEELSTLATGFESDGGLIRYQLYVWLEREVEALKRLCNYNGVEHSLEADLSMSISLDDSKMSMEIPALHQVIMNEKQDFETRLLRVSRRKKWLRANQTLLRTLLSFCGLHGANGGGLVNVRMELVLLLQELQQEQTQHQLLSPLPFPTTLPLLSACIAQQKTVVTDPVHYLQSFSHDILYQICGHKPLPVPGSAKYSSILLIRDLAIALSSCVYQSLCDSDNISRTKLSEELKKSPGMDAIGKLSTVMQDSYLMFSIGKRRSSVLEDVSKVFTEPSKWPGVTALRALLDRDKDEDAPNLCVLLCETYVAVYMSLLLYSLSTCDCHIMYRLVSQVSNQNGWTQLFGGGTKKQVKLNTSSSPLVKENQDTPENILSSGINTVTNITKQRIKLNMKLLNVQLGSGQDSSPDNAVERKLSVREEFVPPDSSLVAKLMTKPAMEGPLADIEYDSGGEESEVEEDLSDYDDDDDPFSNAPIKEENTEQSNPDSYSWAIIRLAVLNLAQKHIEKFLSVAGIELVELPIISSLVYKCLRTTEKWAQAVTERLMLDGKPPDNYIPGCYPDPAATGPLVNKYKAMLEVQNTPFPTKGRGLQPIKRLWRYLVHQECVQPIFIRYIFGKSRKSSTYLPGGGGAGAEERETASRNGDDSVQEDASGLLKIIHKNQDNLTAFCLNKVSGGLVAVSTPREILEINMALLLHPSSWSDRSEDEAEFDILKMQEASDNQGNQAGNFMVPPGDPFQFIPGFGGGGHTPSQPSPSQPGSQVGGGMRTCPVVKRHRQDGVRRLVAHPHLPLYVSGGQDGAVLLWEWSHNQQVSTVRPPGIYAKVNRIVFPQQGNKFGVCDGDGQVALWQAANTATPYLNLQLHNKNCADFLFQGGSSSLLASAGHSSDGRNVALWDTLLPSKRACVQAFNCHEAGAVCLVHAAQHQLLISAGKKGEVCVWDLRQARILHTFRAHEAAVKTISLDDGETMFATGSVDGDIKVFDLVHHKVLHSFHGEHARHGLFKNMSQGAAQVSLLDSTLYSCGADGSFRMRRLPDRDILLNYY